MENLENYGVLEMEAKEKEEVDGGFIWFGYVAAIIVLGVIVAATSTEAY